MRAVTKGAFSASMSERADVGMEAAFPCGGMANASDDCEAGIALYQSWQNSANCFFTWGAPVVRSDAGMGVVCEEAATASMSASRYSPVWNPHRRTTRLLHPDDEREATGGVPQIITHARALALALER